MPRDLAAEAQTVELLLPGMRCGGCIAGIENCLGAVGGVFSARVNLTAKRARVSFDPALTDADALVGALSDAGWDARRFEPGVHGEVAANGTGRDLLLRIGVAGFASMNIMLLSVSVWSGAEAATRDLLHWLSALIALPAVAYAGMPFFRSAAIGARARAHGHGRADLDGDAPRMPEFSDATAESGQHAYFDAAVMLTFFLLIGRYLEHRTRAGARTAAAELMALSARTAMRVADDGTRPWCRSTSCAPAPWSRSPRASGCRPMAP